MTVVFVGGLFDDRCYRSVFEIHISISFKITHTQSFVVGIRCKDSPKCVVSEIIRCGSVVGAL